MTRRLSEGKEEGPVLLREAHALPTTPSNQHFAPTLRGLPEQEVGRDGLRWQITERSRGGERKLFSEMRIPIR